LTECTAGIEPDFAGVRHWERTTCHVSWVVQFDEPGAKFFQLQGQFDPFKTGSGNQQAVYNYNLTASYFPNRLD
jgi:hypothetical protein